MGALLMCDLIVGEGKDAGIIEGGQTFMRLLVLFKTGNVGPEPPINLRPLNILMAAILRIGWINYILQETPTILQIFNTNLTGTRIYW